jgi:Galactose oxidase, central domain
MTDQELEQRLRNWYRAEISEDERAPGELRASLSAIPVQQRRAIRVPRRFTPTQPFPRFAVATLIAILAVGGALYLIRPIQPPIAAPRPTINPSSSPPIEASPASAGGSWTDTGPLSVNRTSHSATLLSNGKVLVAGGRQHTTPPTGGLFAEPSAEVYDPATGVWTGTGRMTVGRFEHAATLLPDGRVLVTGGDTDNTATLDSAELYDPATGSWSPTGRMTEARTYQTATLLPNGKVLVAGGADLTTPLVSAELYDPAIGVWTVTGSMTVTRSEYTATLLEDGKVLVAGGATSLTAAESSAELYDPLTGIWTATGSLTVGRFEHTATLLRDGRVLVAGGEDVNQEGLASAEIYNPATGSWTPTGQMLVAHANNGDRGNHAVTLLLDGRVLVASDDSAEIYNPTTGSWSAAGRSIYPGNQTATLLADGRVLVTAGFGFNAELFDPNAAVP